LNKRPFATPAEGDTSSSLRGSIVTKESLDRSTLHPLAKKTLHPCQKELPPISLLV
jgi:hypothetical protein